MTSNKSPIEKISIEGLRGFGKIGAMELGIPNGKQGSGLTIMVGPNNSGKSTIVEAFHAISMSAPPEFPEGKRNKKANERISIKVTAGGDTITLRTVKEGGSKAEWVNNVLPFTSNIFILPSRRNFKPYFRSSGKCDRTVYMRSFSLPSNRGQLISLFPSRILYIQESKRDDFDRVLGEVLSPLPNWMIDQSDNGDYYIKFNYGDLTHNSDGLGEGLISILFIIDALYDSNENDMIVIDEPELSLHPSLQKKLNNLFAKYAANGQIILATHSPYFIDWKSIKNGAKIMRVVKENNDTKIYQMSPRFAGEINGLLNDLNNPHVLGLNANEVFFLDDKVILVEGQEDVIFYNKIMDELDIEITGDFYGWGVGGSSKMNVIARILCELGFKKVVGILDKGKESEKDDLTREFPEYEFFCIPADDVRTKAARKAKGQVIGLVNENGMIRAEYKDEVKNLFHKINLKLS